MRHRVCIRFGSFRFGLVSVRTVLVAIGSRSPVPVPSDGLAFGSSWVPVPVSVILFLYPAFYNSDESILTDSNKNNITTTEIQEH